MQKLVFPYYQVADRLTGVVLRNSSGISQARFFTYNGRGFLTKENHPESGVTFWKDHDARGHALRLHQTTAGPSPPITRKLRFERDSFERLVKVFDETKSAGENCSLLKELEYALDNDQNDIDL